MTYVQKNKGHKTKKSEDKSSGHDWRKAPFFYYTVIRKFAKAYSYFNASTGLALATFTDCRLTVKIATKTDRQIARIKGKAEIDTRYSKAESHLLTIT